MIQTTQTTHEYTTFITTTQASYIIAPPTKASAESVASAAATVAVERRAIQIGGLNHGQL